jgi:response regulator RpfG family c-di-GMP phosphodiesterase
MEKIEHTLLCIDDEQNILNSLKRLLRKENYRMLTANSGAEGLQILAENEVHIVVSDQRMPGMNGTEFLKKVKEGYRDIIRIILTGYTDVDSISEAINEGHIYKFFLKPWNDQNLKLEIRQAFEQYDLIQMNRYLHDQLFQQNEELKTINENLEAIIQERTMSLEVQNKALQISHAILDDLPIPILGISSELIVAMVNKAAMRCCNSGSPVQLGGNVMDFFETNIAEDLTACLSKNEKRIVTCRSLEGRQFSIEMTPLSGRFRNQGVIMTLH